MRAAAQQAAEAERLARERTLGSIQGQEMSSSGFRDEGLEPVNERRGCGTAGTTIANIDIDMTPRTDGNGQSSDQTPSYSAPLQPQQKQVPQHPHQPAGQQVDPPVENPEKPQTSPVSTTDSHHPPTEHPTHMIPEAYVHESANQENQQAEPFQPDVALSGIPDPYSLVSPMSFALEDPVPLMVTKPAAQHESWSIPYAHDTNSDPLRRHPTQYRSLETTRAELSRTEGGVSDAGDVLGEIVLDERELMQSYEFLNEIAFRR